MDQGNCASPSAFTVNQYPRAHLLATDARIFYANRLAPNNLRGTAFLEVQAVTCPTFPSWKVKDAPNSNPENYTRQWTSTVHYVWYDELQNVHDTLYMIGGTDRDACQFEVVYENVDRMVDPSENTWWSGTVYPLNTARKRHNAVILMDGSILVVGGLDSSCAALFEPERLKPVEAFGTFPTQWRVMAKHELEREEHSVALLLPTGEVWLGGGTSHTHSYHSFEVYRPPYLFHGRVPSVLSVSSINWPYSSPQTINVRCYDDAEPERVALIRLASVTHGFDMGQRYVQLRENQAMTQLPDGSWNVFVNAPQFQQIAPPGYCWLTVRDSNGRPSAGTLIKLV